MNIRILTVDKLTLVTKFSIEYFLTNINIFILKNINMNIRIFTVGKPTLGTKFLIEYFSNQYKHIYIKKYKYVNKLINITLYLIN